MIAIIKVFDPKFGKIKYEIRLWRYCYFWNLSISSHWLKSTFEDWIFWHIIFKIHFFFSKIIKISWNNFQKVLEKTQKNVLKNSKDMFTIWPLRCVSHIRKRENVSKNSVPGLEQIPRACIVPKKAPQVDRHFGNVCIHKRK